MNLQLLIDCICHEHNASDYEGTLVQPLGWAHACLDGQATYVLPPLLQQTDQVVDSQHDVRDQFILRHSNIANCDTKTQHLLELKFDGGLDFGYFLGEVFVMGDGCRKFAG